MSISGVTFQRCTGSVGGALSVLTAEVLLQNCVFYQSQAELGAAVSCGTFCSLFVYNTSFVEGYAKTAGTVFPSVCTEFFWECDCSKLNLML